MKIYKDVNLHIHTTFSDGKSTPEQILAQAGALGMKKISFEADVILKLQNCTNEKNFMRHLQGLKNKVLLGHDDYSLVVM